MMYTSLFLQKKLPNAWIFYPNGLSTGFLISKGYYTGDQATGNMQIVEDGKSKRPLVKLENITVQDLVGTDNSIQSFGSFEELQNKLVELSCPIAVSFSNDTIINIVTNIIEGIVAADYIPKAEKNPRNIISISPTTLTNVILNRANFILNSNILGIRGFNYDLTFNTYPGQIVGFRNNQVSTECVFYHNDSSAVFKFKMLLNRNLSLKFGETIWFELYGNDLIHKDIAYIRSISGSSVDLSDPFNIVINAPTSAEMATADNAILATAEGYTDTKVAAAIITAETAAAIYTDSAVSAAVTGLFDDRGNYNASSNLFPSSGGSGTSGAILKADIWTISSSGTLGGVAVNQGDFVRALVNTPGQTSTNWCISEGNLGYVPENKDNKATTVISNETSNILYASVKACVDYFQQKLTDVIFGNFGHGLTKVDAELQTDDELIFLDASDSFKAKRIDGTWLGRTISGVMSAAGINTSTFDAKLNISDYLDGSRALRLMPYWATDFLNAATTGNPPFIGAAIASGSCSVTTSTAGRFGEVNIFGSATTNSGFRWKDGGGSFEINANNNGITFDKLMMVFSSNVAKTIYVGFHDSIDHNQPVNGAYFEIPTGSNNIYAKTSVGSVRTSQLLGALTDSTYYHLKITYIDLTTGYLFEVYPITGGSAVYSYTINTNQPTVKCGAGISATTTAGAILICTLDFMGFGYTIKGVSRGKL